MKKQVEKIRAPLHQNILISNILIRLLELERKEGISRGKNWHSMSSLLPVFIES